MKKNTLFLFTVIVATALSCSKSKTVTPTPAAATTVEVTVDEGRTGTAAATATVYLYQSQDSVTSNTPKYTQTTDQNNTAKITVAYQPQYFVVVKKGTESNYYSGLIPIGIFATQTDIDSSPFQSPAGVIGGVKYQDTNGDGKIDSKDDAAAPTVSVKVSTNNTFTTTVY